MPWMVSSGRWQSAGRAAEELKPGYYNPDHSISGPYLAEKVPSKGEILDNECPTVTKVLKEVSDFWAAREQYQAWGIPQKRGMILYGPPGTGKTTLLRSLITWMIEEIQGVVMDLTRMDHFQGGFELIRHHHPDLPVMAVIEDIDQFCGGGWETQMINFIDGTTNVDGILFMATTNFIDEIPGRVKDRPGRFDTQIEIGYPTAGTRRNFISGLIKTGLGDEDLTKLVNDTEGLSIAHIRELMISTYVLRRDYQLALEHLKVQMANQAKEDADDYED